MASLERDCGCDFRPPVIQFRVMKDGRAPIASLSYQQGENFAIYWQISKITVSKPPVCVSTSLTISCKSCSGSQRHVSFMFFISETRDNEFQLVIKCALDNE